MYWSIKFGAGHKTYGGLGAHNKLKFHILILSFIFAARYWIPGKSTTLEQTKHVQYVYFLV